MRVNWEKREEKRMKDGVQLDVLHRPESEYALRILKELSYA